MSGVRMVFGERGRVFATFLFCDALILGTFWFPFFFFFVFILSFIRVILVAGFAFPVGTGGRIH